MKRTSALAVAASIAIAVVVLGFGIGDGQAQAIDREDGLGMHIAARALTPHEAAAGVPLDVRYFGTFAEAVEFASGGSARIGPEIKPGELTQELLSPGGAFAALGSTTVVGIDYDDTFFGTAGGSITWYVSNTQGCNGGGTYVAYSMPGGWDNRVSSARAFSGCATYTHYQLTNLGGVAINCPCVSMGIMDNQTSSERWAP